MDACVHGLLRGHMDTSHTQSQVVQATKRSWRRHSEEFKARVIGLALQPHASMAAVALANGLNANMLRRWVREAHPAPGAAGLSAAHSPAAAAFVQLPLPQPALALTSAPVSAPAPSPVTSVVVQIQRRDTSVHVTLPLGRDSAAWLREVLA